jgi:hypothetical protein
MYAGSVGRQNEQQLNERVTAICPDRHLLQQVLHNYRCSYCPKPEAVVIDDFVNRHRPMLAIIVRIAIIGLIEVSLARTACNYTAGTMDNGARDRV